MALRVNTNVASLNAQRQLGMQNASLNKSLERLSSGLRINRAADDAAGLAISETLKAQITGINQAVANSQDSINLIQTAEGGLNETTNILQRMRELSVQAANDTYTQGDRDKIETEMDQLKDELTRISQTTQFNSRNLLDGSIGQSRSQVNASVSVKANARIGAVSATTGVAQFGDMISSVAINNTLGATISDGAIEFKIVATQTTGVFNMEVRSSDGALISTLNNVTNSAQGPASQNIFQAGTNQVLFTLNGPSGPSGGAQVSVTFGTVAPSIADIGDVATVQVVGTQSATTNDQALTFQIGQNEGQILKFGIADYGASALHLEGVTVSGTSDADSRIKAQNMIGVIDEALRKVNTERSHMGAVQNRLEHSIANLNVAGENLSSSESRIRDTDVAVESANLTRSQILVQAGTAMLAQANATSQNALSLLKG